VGPGEEAGAVGAGVGSVEEAGGSEVLVEAPRAEAEREEVGEFLGDVRRKADPSLL